MRAAVHLAAVSALALGLAACNPPKKAEDAPAAPGAPAAEKGAPSGPATGAVDPNTLPRRQPGLWETSMTVKGEDQPPVTTQMCLDAASEQRSSVWGNEMSREMCQRYEVVRQPDGSYRFGSTCNMGSGGVTRSEGTASGDLRSNYVVRMRSTTSGAELEMLNRDQEFTIAAKRLGPCKAGQRGGDMIINGRVVANLNDLPGPGSASGKR